MSYILTALRKSEAERAKGAVPRLTTRHEFEAVPRRRGRIWPAVAVAALALNSLLVAVVMWNPTILPWSSEQAPDPVQAAATASGPERATQVSVAQAPAVETDRQPSTLTRAVDEAVKDGAAHQTSIETPIVQSATTVNGKATTTQSAGRVAAMPETTQSSGAGNVLAPAAAPLDAGRDAKPSVETLEAKPIQTAKAVQTPVEKAPQSTGATASSRKPTPTVTKPAAKVQKTAVKKPLQQIALAPPEASAEAVTGSGDQASSDPYDEVPELWRMSREFRARVPKFSISVHVYAPEDDHRFIIVDRQKYGEGDRLKGGVKIEAILPSGVVFQVNDQKFKLTSS